MHTDEADEAATPEPAPPALDNLLDEIRQLAETATGSLLEQRDRAFQERNELIKRAVELGATSAELETASKLSASRLSVIRRKVGVPGKRGGRHARTTPPTVNDTAIEQHPTASPHAADQPHSAGTPAEAEQPPPDATTALPTPVEGNEGRPAAGDGDDDPTRSPH